MKKRDILMLPLALLLSLVGHASEDIIGNVSRNIVSMGCHLNDTTCYLNVDSSVGKLGECFSTSIRWRSDAVNGKEIFSLFMGAKMANKPISINISSDCFSGAGNYPTFSYMAVQ